MKPFEKVIIILAVAVGCAGIILILTFALAPAGGKETRALSPYTAPLANEALITYVAGDVFLNRNAAWQPVEIGERVTAGDAVRTFENGFCDLQLGERVIISVRPNTAFRLEEALQSADGVRSDTRLLNGSLLYKVERLADADRVRVTAGPKAFGVRGTEFLVERRGERIVCGVKSGRVDVFAAEGTTPELVIPAGREARVDEVSGVTGASVALAEIRRELLDRLDALTYVNLAPGAASRLVKVAVEVDPVTAAILLDGATVGYGTYAGIVTAGTPLNLILRKNGYREQSFTITPKPGENRIYSFKLDLDDPDKGAAPADLTGEYETRLKKLEDDYRRTVADRATVSKERDALKKDLEAAKKENARVSAELEDAQRKIREAVDKLQ
jgi:hypothetical protein